MKFSKKSEYALRALVAMSAHQGSLQTIPKISDDAEVPPKFLEQILLALRNAGFLQSRRGAGGGYLLERSPASISLLEVVEAVEKKSVAGQAPSTNNPVDLFLAEIDAGIRARLAETTIEELVRLGQQQGASNFEI